MNTRLTTRMRVVVTVAALAACQPPPPYMPGGTLNGTDAFGGIANSGPGAQPAASVEGFCTALIDAYLARYAACFGGRREDWARAFPEQLDKARVCPQWKAAVENRRASLAPSAADACVSFVTTQTYDVVFYADLARSHPANSCGAALVGAVPASGACSSDVECDQGSFCTAAAGQCSGQCKRYASNGAACGPAEPCGEGLTCVTLTGASTGVCRPDLGPNASCSPGITADCVESLSCTARPGESGTCQKRRTSGSCQREDVCAAAHTCVDLTPTQYGSCRPEKRLGDDCTSGMCGPFMACVSSRCVAYSTAGGPCGWFGTDYRGCLSSYCDAAEQGQGECVSLREANRPCSAGAQCVSGVCESETCVAACAAP